MKKIILSLFLFLSLINLTYAKSDNQEAVDAYNLGIDLYQSGDTNGSVLSFKKATKLDQNFYEAFYNLAMVLSSLNKKDEAIDAFTRALTLEPKNYECMYDLAETLYKRGYLMKSASYLNKIPETSENYEEAQKLLKTVKERQVIVAREIEAKKQAQNIQKEENSGIKKEENVNPQKEEVTNTKKTEEIKQPAASDNKIVTNPKNNTNSKYISTFTDIKSPSGIAIDSTGNIYIASYGDNTIYKIDTTGKKTEFVSSNILEGPIGICIDKDDNLYIANYTKGNILKVTPQGAPYLFTKIEKPYYITASKNYLYVTEQKTNTVVKYSL